MLCAKMRTDYDDQQERAVGMTLLLKSWKEKKDIYIFLHSEESLSLVKSHQIVITYVVRNSWRPRLCAGLKIRIYSLMAWDSLIDFQGLEARSI